MKRVVVIGTTGSGKSTFAKRLAAILSVPYVELDRFLWAPNWQQRTRQEYCLLLEDVLAQDGWVIDGNTRENRDRVWGEADTVIWLNYSFPVTFSRLMRRTVLRVCNHEEVFPGCVETFRSQFFSKDSLLIWFFKTYWKRKKAYRALYDEKPYSQLTMLELRDPRQAQAYLKQLRNLLE